MATWNAFKLSILYLTNPMVGTYCILLQTIHKDFRGGGGWWIKGALKFYNPCKGRGVKKKITIFSVKIYFTCFSMRLTLKDARSYFSKFSFIFNLKDHHTKDVNFKFIEVWRGQKNFCAIFCISPPPYKCVCIHSLKNPRKFFETDFYRILLKLKCDQLKITTSAFPSSTWMSKKQKLAVWQGTQSPVWQQKQCWYRVLKCQQTLSRSKVTTSIRV